MLINANSIDRQLIFFFVTIILERFVISMPAWTKSYFSPYHKFINFSIAIPPLYIAIILLLTFFSTFARTTLVFSCLYANGIRPVNK